MEDQSDDSKKLNFLSEQLALHQKSSGSRRYSPQLLATCLMWENSSPATYKLFVSDDVLCLPSQKHLKRISSSGTCESDLNQSTINYIYQSQKQESVSHGHGCVNFDRRELYSCKQVDLSGGKFHVLTDQGGVAKTVLCYMIKSTATNYRVFQKDQRKVNG